MVVTWNRETRIAAVYVNGNLRKQLKFDIENINLKQTNHAHYQIGLEKDSGHVLRGCIRDLAVFTRALGPTEVADFYRL